MRTEQEVKQAIHALEKILDRGDESWVKEPLIAKRAALLWTLSESEKPRSDPVWEDMGGMVVEYPRDNIMNHPVMRGGRIAYLKSLVDPEEEEWRAWEARQKRPCDMTASELDTYIGYHSHGCCISAPHAGLCVSLGVRGLSEPPYK